ncbi:MAG TPA: hypothetical protein VGB53_00030 [Rubricoccaceae bacterium]
MTFLPSRRALRFAAAWAAVAAAAPAAVSPALAQGQNNYGSVYSRYGLGERTDFGSSQSEMIGGAQTALRSVLYNGLVNPALWSDQQITTFSASVGIQGIRSTDASSDGASRATAGDVAAVQLGIPLLPSRLGLTLAYRPYSRVNYRAAIPGVLMTEDDTTAYALNQEGGGGLQRISGGLGLRIGQALQIGASADVLFGTVEYVQRTTFEAGVFDEVRQARSTRLRGISGTLGAAATARALAREDDALTLGLAVTLPTRLSGSQTLTLGESLDRDTLATETDGSATLPLLARGGLSYRSGARWLAAVDAVYEPWSRFESTLPVGGYNEAAGLDDLRDRLRVGGGVEIVPAGRNRNAGILSRTAYRLGAYGERGLYAPDGSTVQTLALTGGLSVPNRISGAHIDLGFEVGTRGATEGALVRDVFARGSLTLNFGERWFIRRRIE